MLSFPSRLGPFRAGACGSSSYIWSLRWGNRIHMSVYLWSVWGCPLLGFPVRLDGKESDCIAGHIGSILSQEDPLKKGMPTHSSILAWRVPWRERPGGQQSMGLQRVRHSLATRHTCIPRLYSLTFRVTPSVLSLPSRVTSVSVLASVSWFTKWG